jgi:uncharacterized RDD family membrane protein YckC
MYSDDGRWWWNGQQWVPVTGQTMPLQPAWPYAGFWVRVGAYLLDGLVILAAAILYYATFALIVAGLYGTLGAGVIGIAILGWLGAFVAVWFYFSIQESSRTQATLGKRWMGIYVTDRQGQKPSFGRATGRYFAQILTRLIPFAIGYLMVIFTAQKQALHDMLAGTVVLKGKPGLPTPAGTGSTASSGAILGVVVAGVAVILLPILLVIVLLSTSGGAIANVFSNIVVGLQTTPSP